MPVKILCKRGYEDTVTDDAGCVRLNAADLLPGETPQDYFAPSGTRYREQTP